MFHGLMNDPVLPSDISKLGEKKKIKKKCIGSWLYYLSSYTTEKTAASQNHYFLME
jgi:hypothetical protein